jgi:hypothetical protein
VNQLSDPVVLVRTAADYLSVGNWKEVAALCDPVSLATFRYVMVEGFGIHGDEPLVTLEEFAKALPDAPAPVIEYQYARYLSYALPVARLRREFPGVNSLAELKMLEPASLYTKFLEGRSPQSVIERLVERRGVSRQQANVPPTTMPRRYEVLGAVLEGESYAHVVYREVPHQQPPMRAETRMMRVDATPRDEDQFTLEQWHRGNVSVETCRRQADGSWRLLAHIGLLGAGAHVYGTLDARE